MKHRWLAVARLPRARFHHREQRSLPTSEIYFRHRFVGSAREFDVDVVAAQNGADDYLVKPFDKNELLARVKVGVRVLALETSLANRVKELEARASEIQELKLQMPL